MCFPSGSAVKNPPSMQQSPEVEVRPRGHEDPLEEGMATHSSILTWRIPWTEEYGGLQSTVSQRAGHNWSNWALSTYAVLFSPHDKLVCEPPSRVPILWPHGLGPTRLLCPWNFPGKNPGVGCHSLLQGIFPTQGSNSDLLGLQKTSLQNFKEPPCQRHTYIQPVWNWGSNVDLSTLSLPLMYWAIQLT